MHRITDVRRGTKVMSGFNEATAAAAESMGTEESCLACTAVHLPLKRSETLVFDCQKDLVGDSNSERGLIRLLGPTHSLYKTRSRSGISFWCNG